MALSRVKTWVAAEVLYAADLNAEFDNILNNPISLISPWTTNVDGDGFSLVDMGEVEFRDAAANPSASARFRRNGSQLIWAIEDARTNTVLRPYVVQATTSGAPAASIGVGQLFRAESADENPAEFGALDFVASDVGAGTEDTYLEILLRIAGAALAAAYRFQATDAFTAIFSHTALTANRTITIPDASFTIPTSTGVAATQAEMETATDVTVFASPGRTQYHPGVAKHWGKHNNAGTVSASYNTSSVTDTAVGDHTVNLTTAMSSANYASLVTTEDVQVQPQIGTTPASGTFQIIGRNMDAPFALADLGQWYHAAFGDQA